MRTLEPVGPDQAAAWCRLFQLYCDEKPDRAGEDVGQDGQFDACPVAITGTINDPAIGAYWIRQDGAGAACIRGLQE